MSIQSKLIGSFFLLFIICAVLSVGTKLVGKKPVLHYSKGERIGVLRKLSKKGLFYKTYEGELMLNAGLGSVKLDTFNFSVSDESVADSLLHQIGETMKLQYNEYLFVPYNVGATSYLVDGYEIKKE